MLPDVPPRHVTRIVHAAAVTRFDVSPRVAREVNVLGARRVADFARRCPALDRFVLLSTIYSSGLSAGPVEEGPVDDAAGFANQYEWSKWRAETDLAQSPRDLPWQVHRIATIWCEDESGRVGQFNVAHQVLRLLFGGLLPVVPGSPSAPIHLVTAQFVVDAVWRLAREAEGGRVYNVCFGDDGLDLRSFLSEAYDAFMSDAVFRKRRIMTPPFVDEIAFELMADSASRFSRDALGLTMTVMRPFVKQLFVHKRVRNDELLRVLAPAHPPDLSQLIRSACAYLVRTAWGVAPEPGGAN